MPEKTIVNEQAIIDEIMARKESNGPRIPAAKMKIFKEKLGAEIQRTGNLRREFVDELLRQLKNGDL